MPVGSKGHVGLAKETTWGTAVTSIDQYLPIISESLNLNIEQIYSEAQKGLIDEPSPYTGLKTLAGDIVLEVHPASFGHILRSAMEDPESVASDGDVEDLHLCEAAWDESVDDEVAVALDEDDKKEGDASVELTVGADAAAGDILATDSITSTDISGGTAIRMWIKSSVACDSGDLQLLLSETANCGGTPDALNIGALSAGVWTEVTLTLDSSLDEVISIGLKLIVDKGAMVINVDDIRLVTSGEASSAYEHIFVPRQDDFSSDCPLCPYTIEIYRDQGNAFQYKGAVVNTLNMSFGVNEKILRATAGILAKDIDSVDKTVPSFETTNPFMWDDAVVKIATVQNNNLEAFAFTLDNKLTGKPTLNNSNLISRLYRNGGRSIELSMEIDFDSQTQYDIFEAQTQQAFEITLTGASIETGHNYKMVIDIPKMLYTAYPLNISGPGLIISNVTGKAVYDSTSGYAMKITLTNEETSY